MSWFSKKKDVPTLMRELGELSPESCCYDNANWVEANRMWSSESKIFKQLAGYGIQAQIAAPEIIKAADRNLWDHCEKRHKRRLARASSAPRDNYPLTLDTLKHTTALVDAMSTLIEIKAECSHELCTLVLDVLQETLAETLYRRSLSVYGLPSNLTSFQSALGAEELRIWTNARAVALLLAAYIAASLPSDCADTERLTNLIVQGLDDDQVAVQACAAFALAPLKACLSAETVARVRQCVVEIINHPQALAALGQFVDVGALRACWS